MVVLQDISFDLRAARLWTSQTHHREQHNELLDYVSRTLTECVSTLGNMTLAQISEAMKLLTRTLEQSADTGHESHRECLLSLGLNVISLSHTRWINDNDFGKFIHSMGYGCHVLGKERYNIADAACTTLLDTRFMRANCSRDISLATQLALCTSSEYTKQAVASKCSKGLDDVLRGEHQVLECREGINVYLPLVLLCAQHESMLPATWDGVLETLAVTFESGKAGSAKELSFAFRAQLQLEESVRVKQEVVCAAVSSIAPRACVAARSKLRNPSTLDELHFEACVEWLKVLQAGITAPHAGAEQRSAFATALVPLLIVAIGQSHEAPMIGEVGKRLAQVLAKASPEALKRGASVLSEHSRQKLQQALKQEQ